MVKTFVEEDSLRTIAKSALNTAQKWAEERVLKPVGVFVDTVNGQKVLDEVSAYVTEHEEINTALVTRITEIEAENTSLQTRLAKTEASLVTMETRLTKLESRIRSLTTWGLVLAVLVVGSFVAAMVHWTLR